MNYNNQNLGKTGEILAKEYLVSKGYLILETNWRTGHLEVDIIAKSSNNIIVFVEVKTRKTKYYGEPHEFVTKKKQENLIEAAEVFVEKNNLDNDLRFDIISIIINNFNKTIDHIEYAFYPEF
ncbi:MAG: YraN family protein [Bacteroidales bacterium]|nr:YraN family protein [Bacteroidales bacterium]